MKIGELARKTGKTVRALHLYEEMKLLSPDRSNGGFRLYRPDHLARVYWINKLQTMGFKLSQIRGLLEAVEASRTAPEAMDSVRELFGTKLEQTREQVRSLLELESDLVESLAYLEACRGCKEVSAEACAACDDDRHALPEPRLVTGLHLGKRSDEVVAAHRCESDTQGPPKADANGGAASAITPFETHEGGNDRNDLDGNSNRN